MRYMSLTLDVSRVNGWLNADAYCQNRCGARCAGREKGGRQATAAQGACRLGLDCRLGARRPRGAYPKHVAHVCDAGRVETQRLIERRRALPSRERGMRCDASDATRGAGRQTGGRQATVLRGAYRGGLDCRLGAGHGEERT